MTAVRNIIVATKMLLQRYIPVDIIDKIIMFTTTPMPNCPCKQCPMIPRPKNSLSTLYTFNTGLQCTLFYTEWCPYSKAKMPKWARLAQTFNGKTVHGTRLSVNSIDCDKFPMCANQQNIEGYPTFKFYLDGVSLPFDAALGLKLDSGYNELVDSIKMAIEFNNCQRGKNDSFIPE